MAEEAKAPEATAPEAAGMEAAAAPAATSAALLELLGEELLGKAGSVPTAEALAGKKHIMLYFSAHWCPPCRRFTPQLAKAYTASPLADKEMTVIFVSSDQNDKGFQEYYGEMPWLALPFSDKNKKAELSQKYSVQGIPSLIIIDADAKLVTANGRSEYLKYFGLASSSEPCCVVS
eukprot:TRINITY_DN16695_c0_g1_i1.p2 TRINITY_DN16695_c0_g1~~TRINITY_DN16695_c0_g1_i1.p2  ORF type:complete len:202 (+),score=38.69 TRINITY_DN16695_c0_g1_i1:81-608(+)